MMYAGVAICILVGVLLWLYATNQRRTAEHVNAELAAPAYDPPRRQTQTVTPTAYVPDVITQTPTGTVRSVQADVIVPMAQAGFTGVVGAFLAGGLALTVGAENVLPWLFGGFALGLAGVWALNLWQSHRLMWKIERVVGRDLDGDGYHGAPPEPGTFTVNRAAAKAKAGRIVRETAKANTATAYRDFWIRCCTVGTAYRKHGITTVGSPEYAAWDAMRKEFVSMGLLGWHHGIVGGKTNVLLDMAEGRAIIESHIQEKL